MTRVPIAVLAVLAVTVFQSSGAAQDAEPDNSWLEEVKCSEDWISVPVNLGERQNNFAQSIHDGIVALRKRDIHSVELSWEGTNCAKAWELRMSTWIVNGKLPREFQLPEHLYPQIYQCLASE